MKQKCLVIGINIAVVVIFILASLTNVVGYQTQTIKNQSSASRGNWLYVGGSGPGNYTRIQDAIDNASDFDIVFVYAGVYNESIVIDKMVYLWGEDKNVTVINAQGHLPYPAAVITVEADMVYISGFTIQHETQYFGTGIELLHTSSYAIISDNIIIRRSFAISCSQSNFIFIEENNISDNNFGISLESCYGCYINKNLIYNNENGIDIDYSPKCYVQNNSILSNTFGIDIEYSRHCYVENNSVMFNNWSGIDIGHSDYCHVANNSIMNSWEGVSLSSCNLCKILSNKISSNTRYNLNLQNVFISTIKYNIFENSTDGIILFLCESPTISENEISNHSSYALDVINSFSAVVTKNNFRYNKLHSHFWDSQIYWNRNYWGRPMMHPKVIIGEKSFTIFSHNLSFLTINFDWHPTQAPYDIPGVS